MMECNREQALSAKKIALKKLENNDFLGAQRIALKAQRLYADLENLSQLLTICEVHSAGKAKINEELDWYGILQVEATADDSLIRKQYDKLAFCLCPDKNTLPGAQVAFKLVSEAHATLCDHTKRSLYDMKRQCAFREVSEKVARLSNKARANRSHIAVFWTICPHCQKRFVYYQRNLLVRCDVCNKNFFAFKMHEDTIPSRFLFAAPNNSQVSSEVASIQNHRVPNQQVHVTKLHTTVGNMDSEPAMLSTQSKPIKWACSDGGEQEGSCSATSEVLQFSAMNQTHSPAPFADKGTTGGIMTLDPPNQNFVATQKLSRGDTSKLNAAGSGNDERSGKRKQDDGANNNQSWDSCNNKREKKCSSLSDADSRVCKISNDNIAVTEHLYKVDSQGDVNATYECSANYSYEKMFNDSVAGADILSAEHVSCNIDSQGDGNGTHKDNATSCDEEMFVDNVVGSNNQSAEYSLSKMDSQRNGNATEANANSSGAEMFNDNVDDVDYQSAEHLCSEVDNQMDGNAAHEGNVNSGDDRPFNAAAAGSSNQGAEDLPGKMDSQGDGSRTHEGNANSDTVDDQGIMDGNTAHEGNANSGDDRPFNDAVAGSNNQVAEHLPSKMDSQGDGSRTHEGNANFDTVDDQGNMNAEATDTVGDKNNCYSRCLSLPDPNIFDFEKFRDINLFAVGQIWALYDNLDGMPRLYARIMHLDVSDFKVHLAWLEHDAMNEEEDKWTDGKLPVACGIFCLRETRDKSRDRSMFSHIVPLMDNKDGNKYAIYPVKGEIWALYRGWSMEWSLDPDNHRSYEYEVVEVLSNMSADNGATVIPLVRIKGFVNLFATDRDKSSFIIPSSELLRFSHRIPFYRTTGNENVGAPGGFLALNTACLPTDLDAAFSSATLDSCMSPGIISVDLRTEDPATEQVSQKENHAEVHFSTENDTYISSQQNTSPEKIVHGTSEIGDSFQQNSTSSSAYSTYPLSEFHNFEEGRSCEKFEHGQIWALYSDVDRFPNYYGYIDTVESEPFRVHLTWLEACPKQEQEKRWLKQEIPISCGAFEVGNCMTTYDTSESFSHLVNARQAYPKGQIEIHPQVGDIWAIYMNWSSDRSPSSKKRRAEYGIGQIRRRTRASTTVALLTKVDDYVAVFKPDERNETLKIPTEENLRFSHRIPSFQLTEEEGGKLRGFFELDPAAVPDAFLNE